MVSCVLGAPASQFEVAKITGTILPPSLTVHVQPTSATINLGQSVPFTSTVQGGTPPYTYQWYLNGNLISGATANGRIFLPSTAGIHYVHLRATDSNNITAQSETARIAVYSVPVGGYSVSFDKHTLAKPLTLNLALTIRAGTILGCLQTQDDKNRLIQLYSSFLLPEQVDFSLYQKTFAESRSLQSLGNRYNGIAMRFIRKKSNASILSHSKLCFFVAEVDSANHRLLDNYMGTNRNGEIVK